MAFKLANLETCRFRHHFDKLIIFSVLGMVFVSALAEQLAKLLRQVRNKLKYYKEKLKYDCHKFFSTLKLEIYKNKLQIH